jgi:hypothetical protein
MVVIVSINKNVKPILLQRKFLRLLVAKKELSTEDIYKIDNS